MTTMYNLMFGQDTFADLYLHLLGLDKTKVPRFRDCYLDTNQRCIMIYTRTGGGNRDYYESEEICRANFPDDFKGDNPPKGPWNEDLRKNQHFMRDENDDFDSTYAMFYYAFPPEHAEVLNTICDFDPKETPEERWRGAFDRLKSIKPVKEAVKDKDEAGPV